MPVSSLSLYKRGKIRDLHSFGKYLLLITSDRMSIRDQNLPTTISKKGVYLTDICVFWFRNLSEIIPTHFISRRTNTLPLTDQEHEAIAGRAMLVHWAQMLPVECIVRGYLFGSVWLEYQHSGSSCRELLQPGMQLAEKLPEPIFTPTTKSENGPDIPLKFDELVALVGRRLAVRLRDLSLEIYERAAKIALARGIIIVDTKFEFGLIDGELILCDEVFTPDSSRFWPCETYEVGTRPPSYDRDLMRSWADELIDSGHVGLLPRPPESLVQHQTDMLRQFHSRLLHTSITRPGRLGTVS